MGKADRFLILVFRKRRTFFFLVIPTVTSNSFSKALVYAAVCNSHRKIIEQTLLEAIPKQ